MQIGNGWLGQSATIDSGLAQAPERPEHVDELLWRFLSPQERQALASDVRPMDRPCPQPDGTPCDIVVEPPPPFPPWTPPGPPVPPGGPSGPGTPVDDYPPDWDYERDHDIDATISDVARRISDMPDSQQREYRAFVWQDPATGQLRVSNILPFESTSAGTPPASAWGMPNFDTIRAEIHNHPLYLPDGSQNPYAGSPSIGDMQALMSTYRAQAQAGEDQYRLYTVHNGYVSEYDGVMNDRNWTGSPTDPASEAVRGGYYPDLGTPGGR